MACRADAAAETKTIHSTCANCGARSAQTCDGAVVRYPAVRYRHGALVTIVDAATEGVAAGAAGVPPPWAMLPLMIELVRCRTPALFSMPPPRPAPWMPKSEEDRDIAAHRLVVGDRAVGDNHVAGEIQTPPPMPCPLGPAFAAHGAVAADLAARERHARSAPSRKIAPPLEMAWAPPWARLSRNVQSVRVAVEAVLSPSSPVPALFSMAPPRAK